VELRPVAGDDVGNPSPLKAGLDVNVSEKRGVPCPWRERALAAEARVRDLEETVGELVEALDYRDVWLIPHPA
jgi:hypothetical protein